MPKNKRKGVRITIRKDKKGFIINVGGKAVKRALSKIKALEHAEKMRKQMRKNPFIQKF